MKLSKDSKVDVVIPFEKWKCFDGCAVCRLFKKAAEEGMEISSKDIEEAFSKAKGEDDMV